jgi:Asparagine synthase
MELQMLLIDHKLVYLLFIIPGRCELDKLQSKPLLTQPFNDLLPKEFVFRQKHGFELPFQLWQKDALQEQILGSLCGEDTSANFLPFSAGGTQNLWRAFQAGRVSWSRIWAIYVLQQWLVRHGVG